MRAGPSEVFSGCLLIIYFVDKIDFKVELGIQFQTVPPEADVHDLRVLVI